MTTLYTPDQGWHARLVELGGSARAERTIVLTALSLRVVQLIPYPVVLAAVGTAAYVRPRLALTLYVAVVAWSVALFWKGVQRNRVTQAWVLADVALLTVVTVAVGRATQPAQAASWNNWTLGGVNGAAILAAGYLPRRLAIPSVSLLAIAYSAGVWPGRDEPEVASSGLGNALSIMAFAVVTWLVTTLIRATSARMETLARELAMRDREQAEREAREQERTRQHRLLHDTVLSTLTLVSRDTPTADQQQLKERAAADAAYVRGLITADQGAETPELASRLAHLAHHQRAGGVIVEFRTEGLPAALPDVVSDALYFATTEALNNVAKHAQTDRAWLTATGEGDGSVTIRIVDQGVGFDTSHPTSGLGLQESIAARMAEAGGSATIDSAPSEGTMVELRWKA